MGCQGRGITNSTSKINNQISVYIQPQSYCFHVMKIISFSLFQFLLNVCRVYDQTLLHAGADLNKAGDFTRFIYHTTYHYIGATALIMAASRGHLDTVQVR